MSKKNLLSPKPAIDGLSVTGRHKAEAAGWRGTGQDRAPPGRFAWDTSNLVARQAMENNCFGQYLGSKNERT